MTNSAATKSVIGAIDGAQSGTKPGEHVRHGQLTGGRFRGEFGLSESLGIGLEVPPPQYGHAGAASFSLAGVHQQHGQAGTCRSNVAQTMTSRNASKKLLPNYYSAYQNWLSRSIA